MIWNEGVDFVRTASDQDRRSFTYSPARLLINDRTLLYRWTDTALRENHWVSPFWSFADSTKLPDGTIFDGFDRQAELARRLNKTHREYARTRLALSERFNNNMKLLVRARLKVRVWAFYGIVSGQREFKDADHIFFIGGAHQLWIWNLKCPEHLHLESSERVEDRE